MNVPVFHVQTTNIYPAANSHAGGQLNTEFNVRSRETVAVGPIDASHAIQYFLGPSYVHSESDFSISKYSDTAFRIAPGRALVNGHFIEVLDDDGVIVDIAEVKAGLISQGRTEEAQKLTGELVIGLKAFYNTVETMMSSIQVEQATGLFMGIQVAIVPKAEFKLPVDSPSDPDAVTAEIKLGQLTYYNGSIQNNSVSNNYPDKCVIMSADRLGNATEMLDKSYVTKTGLDSNQLYIMAGKQGPDGQITNESTWCPAQSSLMVFDRQADLHPERVISTEIPQHEEAQFVRAHRNATSGAVVSDNKGPVSLALPHKQVDGMHDDNGETLYYKEKYLQLPSADFGNGYSGIVTGQYTRNIRAIEQKINQIYQLTKGKQLMYIDTLNDRADLPPIPVGANPGDYILVGHDNTISYNNDVETSWLPPASSSLYVVLPPIVSSVNYRADINNWQSDAQLDGVRLAKIETMMPESSLYSYTINTVTIDGSPYKVVHFNSASGADGANAFFNSVVALSDMNYRGAVHSDYIILAFDYTDSEDHTYPQEAYFTVNANAGGRAWSDPIQLQGEFSLATTETIGGFLNIDESAEYQDAGYVILDSDGHLRLLDYSLLRSDGLSYQLGQDINIGEGLDLESIQSQLDNYVNERIAFANAYHSLIAANASLTDADRTFVDQIVLTLTLPSEAGVVRINRIDSRFNTCVRLKIRGAATASTIIMISDCARLRIDSNIEGTPTIQLNNTCLYYDASVINQLSVIDSLSLWYDTKFDTVYDQQGNVSGPPALLIQGNEVITLDPVTDITEVNFWDYEAAINDNHYSYALRSITLDQNGTVVGASIYIKCAATTNIEQGYFVAKQPFTLPQSVSLNYPINKLTRLLKIDGCFVHSYSTQDDNGAPTFMVIDTKFTAVSNYRSYTSDMSSYTDVDGGLYIYQDVKHVSSVAGLDPADGAMLLSTGWHFFSGGSVG